ncbi:gamma-glutamylcyclotransferase [Methylobacterium gossipiicola]|uniref:glutathione-specific gamma-glutamylcyclotransferase n=1 Tax=Methylobacterium gossipiicola TaxID=582675 RepID=A0A1I2RDD5_9HYPH|nr:gamma-glutamylcyclotransferase [Methylobacterium gossipiicola]SFG38043.1 cation transport protein ChaC [Methylobacterium gossipiicola]
MPKRPLSLTLDLIARAHPDPVRDDPTAQTFLTDDELGPGLTQALARRPKAGESLWVFGYGSLIWQPEFAFTERRIGTVRGYHRRFCLLQRRFRGSVERPGLVLALDRGGLCRGVAFRLADDDPHATLLPVWRREMRGNGYLGRWVTVETDQGPVTALTFVVNRASDRYTGRLTEPEIADRIATGAGHLGPSAEYLFRTAEACAREGILDLHLWTLQALVAERLEARAAC